MSDPNTTDTTEAEQPRTFTTFEAVGIAEGFIESDDEATTIAAWQHLIDTGAAWSLQGSFGRFAIDLVLHGLCTLPGAVAEVEV